MKIRVHRRTEINPTTYRILCAVLFFLAATGCSGESGKGIFEVRIKDHRGSHRIFFRGKYRHRNRPAQPQGWFQILAFGLADINPILRPIGFDAIR